jgi:phosphohistidine phosphatase SixA
MPLVLDLLRHGEAEPSHPSGDDERPLTARGEQCICALGMRLGGERWRPTRIFSSPIKRARDSALIATREAGLATPVETLEVLGANQDPGDVMRALEGLGIVSGHVVLVGHQPLMGRLCQWLTGEERKLSPGSLLRIELPDRPLPGSGRVVMALDPRDYLGAA